MNKEPKYYYLAKSKIHGVGVFANYQYEKNQIIDVGIEYKMGFYPVITPRIGSYINHSYTPNTYLAYANNVHYIVANRDLIIGEELTINYNACPWFIDPAMPWYK